MNNQFDDITKLLKRKNLIVIGGSPAIGKTIFAINLANNACNNNYHVAYFSLELSNENICKISKVPIKNIITEKIENGEAVDSNNFNTNQLYVCYKPDLTLQILRINVEN